MGVGSLHRSGLEQARHQVALAQLGGVHAGDLVGVGSVSKPHEDRVVLAGITPAAEPVTMPTYPEVRSEYFFEHREAGIVNVRTGCGPARW